MKMNLLATSPLSRIFFNFRFVKGLSYNTAQHLTDMGNNETLNGHSKKKRTHSILSKLDLKLNSQLASLNPQQRKRLTKIVSRNEIENLNTKKIQSFGSSDWITCLKRSPYRIPSLNRKKVKIFIDFYKAETLIDEPISELTFVLKILLKNQAGSNFFIEVLELLDYCAENNVASLNHVLSELSSRKPFSNLDTFRILLTLLQFRPNSALDSKFQSIVETMTDYCFDFISDNIQNYSLVQIKTVLKYSMHSYRYDVHYAFNENFLDAVVASDLIDGSENVDYLNFLYFFISMNYINSSFTKKAMEIFKVFPIDEHLTTLSTLSLLRALYFLEGGNEEFYDILTMIEEKIIEKCLNIKQISLPVIIFDFFEMNYFPQKILACFFKNDKIEQYIKGSFKRQKELALLKYELNRRYYGFHLLPYISEMIKLKRPEFISTSTYSYHLLSESLVNIFGSSCVARSVIYQDYIILDYLMFVDMNGKAIPINFSETSSFEPFEAFTSYSESYRKIVLLFVYKDDFYKPDNKINSLIKTKKRLLESEGFEVLLFCDAFPSCQIEPEIRILLHQAGIRFAN